MTENRAREILSMAMKSNLDPFTIVQFVRSVSGCRIRGVEAKTAFRLADEFPFSAEHIYDAMRCCDRPAMREAE